MMPSVRSWQITMRSVRAILGGYAAPVAMYVSDHSEWPLVLQDQRQLSVQNPSWYVCVLIVVLQALQSILPPRKTRYINKKFWLTAHFFSSVEGHNPKTPSRKTKQKNPPPSPCAHKNPVRLSPRQGRKSQESQIPYAYPCRVQFWKPAQMKDWQDSLLMNISFSSRTAANITTPGSLRRCI